MALAPASNLLASASENLTIEEVLNFLQRASPGEWHLVSQKIREDGPMRDVQAASLLRIGDKVSFFWPSAEKRGQRFVGHVTKINRMKGRLHLLADFGDGRLAPCGLPATMTMKCS